MCFHRMYEGYQAMKLYVKSDILSLLLIKSDTFQMRCQVRHIKSDASREVQLELHLKTGLRVTQLD